MIDITVTGKEMYYNWNRLSMLSRIPNTNKSELERLEETMRVGFQNAYANGDETEKSNILKSVRETLTSTIIKSVDVYMKE